MINTDIILFANILMLCMHCNKEYMLFLTCTFTEVWLITNIFIKIITQVFYIWSTERLICSFMVTALLRQDRNKYTFNLQISNNSVSCTFQCSNFMWEFKFKYFAYQLSNRRFFQRRGWESYSIQVCAIFSDRKIKLSLFGGFYFFLG